MGEPLTTWKDEEANLRVELIELTDEALPGPTVELRIEEIEPGDRQLLPIHDRYQVGRPGSTEPSLDDDRLELCGCTAASPVSANICEACGHHLDAHTLPVPLPPSSAGEVSTMGRTRKACKVVEPVKEDDDADA